ncbi:MAG: BTAD domain-containing putative transcriptional regulator [Armatimonadota bacterium]|nr:BTAD domain-containing putative transcriptional regulator [Armatimonadota bacterium]
MAVQDARSTARGSSRRSGRRRRSRSPVRRPGRGRHPVRRRAHGRQRVREWLAAPRARLQHRYADALAALAEMDEAAGRWELALSRWQALAEGEPHAEHACRRLVRCYLALGRPADADRARERCRGALAELGVAASSETLALWAQISAQRS